MKPPRLWVDFRRPAEAGIIRRSTNLSQTDEITSISLINDSKHPSIVESESKSTRRNWRFYRFLRDHYGLQIRRKALLLLAFRDFMMLPEMLFLAEAVRFELTDESPRR